MANMTEINKNTKRRSFYIPSAQTKEWEQDSEITIDDIEEMRISPIIKFPLSYLKMPIASAGYKVVCQDELQNAVINASLENIWTKLIKLSLQKLDFGFQVVEPVFSTEQKEFNIKGSKIKRDVVILKNVHLLKPADISIDQAETGEILKIHQNVGRGIDFNLNELLWFTNKPEENYGSVYGYSELNSFFGKVKKDGYWIAWKYVHKFLMMDMERGGLGIMKAYAPDKENEDGDNFLDMMVASAEQLMRTGIIGINSSVDPETKTRMFDIETLKDTDNPKDFLSVLNYYSLMALRSLLIPEKALTEGSSGTYNIGEVHADFLTETQEDIQTTSIDDINKQLIPNLNKWNGFNSPCYLVGEGLTNEDKKRNTNLINELIKQNRIKNWHVDWTGIVESTGLTALKAEVIQKDADEEKKKYDKDPNYNNPIIKNQETPDQGKQKNEDNNLKGKNQPASGVPDIEEDEEKNNKNLSEIKLAEIKKRNPAINLKKVDAMYNKANDLKKELTLIINRQKNNTVEQLINILKLKDKDEENFLKKLYMFNVPYRREYEILLKNHMLGIWEESKNLMLEELNINKKIPLPKEKMISLKLRAENISSQHVNTLTYRTKNIVSIGVQNKIDNNNIINQVKEMFDKFSNKELKGVDHVFS